MRTMTRTMTMLGLPALTLSACGQPKQLYADHAWVRLGAVKRNPAAAYFTLHGGPGAATLINVTTDVAIKSEMHESMAAAAGAMTTMKPIQQVAIPAGATVPFQPGGRHVMLFDMNPGIKPGSTLTLTLSFADGTRILQDAGVIGAGDPTPK